MCQADLTPATFEAEVTDDGKLVSDFADEHRCRNFDKINDWAKVRYDELPPFGGFRFGDLG